MRERISDEPPPPLESFSRRTRVRVFVALPVAYQDQVLGAVVLSRTPMSFLKALYRNKFLFGVFFGVLILGVVTISLLTSFTISRPIQALIGQTEKGPAREVFSRRHLELAGGGSPGADS